jgi:hypothetical protein
MIYMYVYVNVICMCVRVYMSNNTYSIYLDMLVFPITFLRSLYMARIMI